MKILVPLNNAECLKAYSQAGADELYLGFYDEKWFGRFGEYADINRMSGFKARANQYDFHEMTEVAKKVKSLGKDVFVTMNSNCYSVEQIEYIQEHYFSAVKEAGIDGLIVSDILLVKAAVEAGINVVASTMCGIYNRDIAAYYRDAGMRRIILPRDLSLDEIASICSSFDDMEYEVFFMRNGCVFSDSYCLGTHRRECGATCGFLRSHPKRFVTDDLSFENRQANDTNDFLYNNHFHNDACGMCALYRMKEMGIGSLKIVGRADNYESVCEDIRLTRRNIELAKEAGSEREYLDHMEYPAHAQRKCMWGFSCYYPEVRFS